MIALIDETTIEHRSGLIYVVASAAVLAEQAVASATLASVVAVPGRKRPFHWVDEGQAAKGQMVAAVDALAAIATGFQSPCGRRGQDAARAATLEHALLWSIVEGAQEIIIESRGSGLDVQDKRLIKQLTAAGHTLPNVRWDTKANPLLWLPDAVCGAYRERHHQAVEGIAESDSARALIDTVGLEVTYVQK